MLSLCGKCKYNEDQLKINLNNYIVKCNCNKFLCVGIDFINTSEETKYKFILKTIDEYIKKINNPNNIQIKFLDETKCTCVFYCFSSCAKNIAKLNNLKMNIELRKKLISVSKDSKNTLENFKKYYLNLLDELQNGTKIRLEILKPNGTINLDTFKDFVEEYESGAKIYDYKKYGNLLEFLFNSEYKYFNDKFEYYNTTEENNNSSYNPKNQIKLDDLKLFGIEIHYDSNIEEIYKILLKTLKKNYYKQAKVLHPDKKENNDTTDFLKLSNRYRELLIEIGEST